MVKYQKNSEESQELLFKVDKLREKIHNLIQIKLVLADIEIITLSQELDLILNRYEESLKSKE